MKFKGILAAVVLALPALATAQTVSTDDSAARVEALFSAAGPASPGCAIAVSQDGQTVIEKAFGLADLERDVPNTTATLFETGSVSKQFTAAAVLLLERDGKLTLGDDIRKHLPEMPDYGDVITVEMLLNHTSGLRDWGSVANAMGKGRGERAFSNAEVLDIVARQNELNYRPGAEYSYTNTGYNLAAIIVERVSGMTLMDFTRQRLFEPLGMTSAQWRDDYNRIVKNRAMAYEPAQGGFRQSMPFMNVYGNGGLMMTIGDLTRWNAAMIADTLGLRAAMERRGVLSDGREIPYARGVVVQSYNGVAEVSHSGATGGYSAWLARYPDRRLSIAMLCNAPQMSVTPLGPALAGIFLGSPPGNVAPTGLPDPSAYAGRFVHTSTGFPLSVTMQGGELRFGGRAWPRISQTEWRRGAETITFVDADSFRLDTADGNRYAYRRISAANPSIEQLAEYAGSYASDETRARYELTIVDGQLKGRVTGWPDTLLQLRPVYRDAFISDNTLVRFRRGPDGNINEMSLGDGRMRDLRAARVK